MNGKNFKKKKSLGQNFLKHRPTLKLMISAGKILPGDTVLEIGPGKGSLTRILLEAEANVIAIEKDRELIPILKEEFAKEIASGSLVLIEGDILELEIKNIFPKKTPYKIVANIPYYITGAVVRKFLSSTHQPETMVIMVQREVAKRIVARDGKESLLSLSVKVYGVPRYIETVKKELFSPKPKVDSAILSIEKISKDFFVDFSEEDFFSVIQSAFSHKRKVLIRNLEKVLPKQKVELIFETLCLPKKIRAEDVSLLEWQNILRETRE